MSLSDEKRPLLPKTALEAAEPVPPPTKDNKDHKHFLGIPPKALAGLSYCTASAGALAKTICHFYGTSNFLHGQLLEQVVP